MLIMKEVSLKSNVLLSLLYQVLTMITPLVTAPYISRVLGADGIGVYSYTNSFQVYFSMFATLGTLSYGSREIARVRDSLEKRSRLFWEIELLTVCTTVISMVIWFLWTYIQKRYRSFYFILAIHILAVAFDISWFYSGIEQFKYIVVQNMIFKILGIITIFVFVKNNDHLSQYMLILALSNILSNISMWLYLPAYIQWVNWREIDIFYHFKETLIYFIPTIASSIYTVLDKTLIGVFTGDPYENGYYEQATKIINIAKSISFVALNNVLVSRMSYLFAEKKYEEAIKRTHRSLNYIMFMGIGSMFGMIGVAPRLIPWFFGNGYGPVIILLRILSPIVIIIGISNCLGSHYYTPIGSRKLSARFLIIGSAVNLCMNIILIPRYKSSGAAIASVIAEALITFLYLHYCDSFITARQLFSVSWKPILSGIIMSCLIGLINVQVKSDELAVILEILGGALSYVLVLFFLKDDLVRKIFSNILQMIKKVDALEG